MLQAALNGDRTADEHPAIPRTPDEIAREARASADAGAQVVHVHAYDDELRESLAAEPVAAMLRAVRSVCNATISGTTTSDIEPDPERKRAFVASWTELPDLVTANQGEDGVVELCELLLSRGIGIEAGLLTLDDAEKFAESGLAPRCVRVLLEPLDADPAEAVAHAAAMEEVLAAAGATLEQVHHGDGIASWAVSERGAARGHGVRTGLEDCIYLPDGTLAPDNASLVRAAAELLRRAAQ